MPTLGLLLAYSELREGPASTLQANSCRSSCQLDQGGAAAHQHRVRGVVATQHVAWLLAWPDSLTRTVKTANQLFAVATTVATPVACARGCDDQCAAGL
jgi:hypothetical protein